MRKVKSDPERKTKVIETKYKPITKGHHAYAKSIEINIVTFCIGPYGAGKTFTPCALGTEMLKGDKIERLILTRPLTTCGPAIGWLPGDVLSKAAPFMRSMFDILNKFLTKKELDEYQKKKNIEIIPLEMMEGLTIDNALVVADEMNSAEYIQILTLLTRIGKNCKMVLIGNTNHTQFPLEKTPLHRFMERILTINNVQLICLTEEDIVRSGIVREIILKCA